MTLDYIRIPTAILRLKNLNMRQKLLLAIVISFNEQGLQMSNNGLSEILDTCPSYVTKLLTSLQLGEYIRIDNTQSRYRRIYLAQNDKVNQVLLTQKVQSKKVLLHTKQQSRKILLCTGTLSTLHQSANITKVTEVTATAHTTQRPMCSEPPTEEQVKEYSTTRGFPNFDARHFVEWYAANDWQHKDGKPVLNWKQTVLSWLRRDQAKEQQAQAEKPEPKRGDPDWLPDEKEAEAIMGECR